MTSEKIAELRRRAEAESSVGCEKLINEALDALEEALRIEWTPEATRTAAHEGILTLASILCPGERAVSGQRLIDAAQAAMASVGRYKEAEARAASAEGDTALLRQLGAAVIRWQAACKAADAGHYVGEEYSAAADAVGDCELRTEERAIALAREGNQ